VKVQFKVSTLRHDNEYEFEVDVVLKSRQLKGWEWEYLVKWKIYHLIKASWVNELDMEHAQETIEKNSTIDGQKNKGNIKCDENINFLLVGKEIAQMYHIKLLVK
jgi:hypothetical protein